MKITYFVLMFFYLACIINVVTVICDKFPDGKNKKGKKNCSGCKKHKKKRELEQPKGKEHEMVQQQLQEQTDDSADMEATAEDVRDILMNVLESEELQKNKKALKKKRVLIGVLSALFSLALIAGGGFGGYKLYKKKKSTKLDSEFQSNSETKPINSDGVNPDGDQWSNDKLPDFEK